MHLERDEFQIAFDRMKASPDDLVATIQAAGYAAQVVPAAGRAAENASKAATDAAPPFFTEALARARRERKPLVLDFHAVWCAPCQEMARTTFPHPEVAALLERYVFVPIDTDTYPDLARRFNVVGLPDIRLLSPDGVERSALLGYQGPLEFAAALQTFLDTLAKQADPGPAHD